MDVKIYGTKRCPDCRVVKSYLLALGTKFEEIMVDSPKLVEYIVNKTGQRRVPVVENDKGFVVGFKPDELKKLVSN